MSETKSDKPDKLGPDRVSTAQIAISAHGSPGGVETTALWYRAVPNSVPSRPAALILAHGAGAGQQHPFMVGFANGLAARGIDIVTFNFPYMEQRRRMPDRMPLLVECYRAVIAATRETLASARQHLFIGGKSMGGRAATHVAAEEADADAGTRLAIDGLVLLGYPLHPPGRLDKMRDAHLPDVKRPMLFVQGARDTFGTPDELKPVLARLSPRPTLHAVAGGDHSFKLSGSNAAKQAALYGDLQDTIAEWIAGWTAATP